VHIIVPDFYRQPKGKSVRYLMGKMLIQKTLTRSLNAISYHAHNVHFTPIEMTLEALFNFDINIEEATVNPGKDAEGNAKIRKDSKTETTVPSKQGGGKANITRKVEVSPLQLLKVKKYHLVIYVAK
jgi:hypothetical protein